MTQIIAGSFSDGAYLAGDSIFAAPARGRVEAGRKVLRLSATTAAACLGDASGVGLILDAASEFAGSRPGVEEIFDRLESAFEQYLADFKEHFSTAGEPMQSFLLLHAVDTGGFQLHETQRLPGQKFVRLQWRFEPGRFWVFGPQRALLTDSVGQIGEAARAATLKLHASTRATPAVEVVEAALIEALQSSQAVAQLSLATSTSVGLPMAGLLWKSGEDPIPIGDESLPWDQASAEAHFDRIMSALLD